MKNWSVITSLRQVAEVGLPYAEKALAEEHAAAVHFISNDPQYQKIFVGNDKPFSPELAEFLQTGMTKTAITNARAAADAASIVFAQSMLDDCAWSIVVEGKE
jgi:hypothetical protein